MANLKLIKVSTKLLLCGLLSTSRTTAYFWGDMGSRTPDDRFNDPWVPDWRGSSMVDRCISTQVRDGGGKLQAFGIINGAYQPTQQLGTAQRLIEGHNAEAMVFYTSTDCTALGTDQFIVVKFKRDVQRRAGGTEPFRGVQFYDFNTIQGLNMNDYNSFQEINSKSYDWRWVQRSGVPNTSGRAVVFSAYEDGSFSTVAYMSVKTADTVSAFHISGYLAKNDPRPAIGKLQTMLREAVLARPPATGNRAQQLNGANSGTISLGNGGSISFQRQNPQPDTHLAGQVNYGPNGPPIRWNRGRLPQGRSGGSGVSDSLSASSIQGQSPITNPSTVANPISNPVSNPVSNPIPSSIPGSGSNTRNIPYIMNSGSAQNLNTRPSNLGQNPNMVIRPPNPGPGQFPNIFAGRNPSPSSNTPQSRSPILNSGQNTGPNTSQRNMMQGQNQQGQPVPQLITNPNYGPDRKIPKELLLQMQQLHQQQKNNRGILRPAYLENAGTAQQPSAQIQQRPRSGRPPPPQQYFPNYLTNPQPINEADMGLNINPMNLPRLQGRPRIPPVGSLGSITVINGIPQYPGSPSGSPSQGNSDTAQIPNSNNGRIEEEPPEEPRIPPVEFEFESGNIPEKGPTGFFNNMFGKTLPFLEQTAEQPKLSIPTTLDPMVEDLYGDPRENEVNFPVRGWRGEPTSPTLRGQDVYGAVPDPDVPEGLSELIATVEEFLLNPPELEEEESQYDDSNLLDAFMWPSTLPPPDLPPLAKYTPPRAVPGTLQEITTEEQEHFPGFFDESIMQNKMEEEFEGNQQEDRVDIYDFDNIPSRRLTPDTRLFQDWRYNGVPILGNLQTLPTSYLDPNWQAIDTETNNLINQITADWKSFYRQKWMRVVEQADKISAEVKASWDDVYPFRAKAVAQVQAILADVERSGELNQPQKQAKLLKDLTRIRDDIQRIDSELIKLRGLKVQTDTLKKETLETWQKLWYRRLRDLELRYSTWRALATTNIERTQARLMSGDNGQM
ncbi:hypothetical protein H072_10282 [Dactylellina haptotyla CBS 200.50]|uniref:Uncharacterized protein n=1 Tax=Dactylellina haptotyla (strain CBS 200.50) TaxID=1284197 RepID=S8BLM9_DACHA|nr:hypothetical protein H072_10282 [Dactylellina haptotyla CBS 200.50]